MSEREDWFGLDEAEEEGLATSSGDLRPDTDEFGRDDPAAIERERRRREREERRRQGGGKGREPRGKRREPRAKGERGGLFKRRPRRKKAPPERPPAGGAEQPPTEAQPPGAEPTQVRPAAPAPPTPPTPKPLAAAESPSGAEPPAAEPAATRSAATALRRRGSRSGRGNYRRRRIAFIVLGLLGILLIWFLVALFQPFAGAGKGEGEVIINVPEQATAGEVADALSEQGVISNGTLFELRLRLSGKSDSILPGRHVMASGMSYGAAIDQLTQESSEGLVALTIPEGDARRQSASVVSEAGITGNYVKSSRSFKGFNPARYGAPKNPPSLEGFLFPATYELEPGANVRTLIAEQLKAFQQNIGQVNMSYAKKRNLNTYDVLKIASMVDDEAQDPKELRLIAAVIYNRLRRGIPLGIDATTRYEFNSYTEPITRSQLQSDSGYNTRRNVGLPPTPITNPGLAAIKAAANPARVNYLFFVVKPGTGCPIQHSFTASEQEFERLEAEYQRALQEQGGSPTGDC